MGAKNQKYYKIKTLLDTKSSREQLQKNKIDKSPIDMNTKNENEKNEKYNQLKI